MAWPPGVSDFQSQFAREFIYGQGLDKVTDNDILRAFAETQSNFNQSLYDTASEVTIGFLYLAAHRLWININNAGGLSAVPRGRGVRAQADGIVNSKGVGQVNVTFQAPPERVSSSPTLSALWASPFGRSWIEMFGNRLIGNMAVVCGPNANWPSGGPQ